MYHTLNPPEITNYIISKSNEMRKCVGDAQWQSFWFLNFFCTGPTTTTPAAECDRLLVSTLTANDISSPSQGQTL